MKNIPLLKPLLNYTLGFLIILILVFINVANAYAVSVEEIFTPYYNPNLNNCQPTSTGFTKVPDGGKLYVLGDSITVGIEDTLRNKLQEKDITPYINASVSRSWNGAGNSVVSTQGTPLPGKDAIKEDEAKQAGVVSGASGIVIALGTNGGASSNPIESAIDEIRRINSSAPIWWVNTVGSSAWPNNISNLGSFNEQLVDLSATKNFQIINWFSAVNPTGDPTTTPTNDPTRLLSDGIHPNAAGIQKLSTKIVTDISGGDSSGSTTASETGVACCSGAGTTVAGNNNEEKVWNYLVGNLQLSAIQAAGIMGNIQQESGFSTTIVNKSSGAYGLIQWLGGRKTALQNFARGQGKDMGDISVQLEFMKQELESDYYRRRVFDPIKASQSLEESTRIWLEKFEIPCTPGSAACAEEMNVRLPFAQNWLTRFGSNTATAVGNSPSSTCASQEGGTGVSADGFVFPLRTNQQTIKSKGWCFESQSNCHHDYNAADIFAPTGTEVIAARGGQVILVKSGPTRIAIKADDGNIYYYTHMGAGTAVVSKGQTVAAGATLGRVGTKADAAGTPEHLHIDILPGDRYDNRPGCAGSACSSLPFINIQPPLTEAFKNLPE